MHDDPLYSGEGKQASEYELLKEKNQIAELYSSAVGKPLANYDRLQYAMRVTFPERNPYLFFYIMRRVSVDEEVGHWVTKTLARVDDATEERLNEVCNQLVDGEGNYGSMNSETGYWETGDM